MLDCTEWLLEKRISGQAEKAVRLNRLEDSFTEGYTRAIERMWLWSIRLQVRRVFIKKSTVRFWSETHALFQASNGLRDSNKETLVRANRWKVHAVLCLTDSFVTCPLEPGHKEEYLFPKIMPRQSPYVFPTPCSWANFWVSFSILFVMISLKLYSKAFF